MLKPQVAEADVKFVCVQDLPPDLAHDGGRLLLRAPPGQEQVVNEVLFLAALGHGVKMIIIEIALLSSS